jgi:hypothetical protein
VFYRRDDPIHGWSSSEIFRFGYGKAADDKKVPDPVGSECNGILTPARAHTLARLLNSISVADCSVPGKSSSPAYS